MRNRTKAREYALQILYQLDVTQAEAASATQEFWLYHQTTQDVRGFATRLVEGTLRHLEQINALIASCASNWEMSRMAVVDRNILRMGVYELLYQEGVPPKVCLNEAIELAKRFGDEESSRFVNGILDTIHKTRVAQANEAAPPAGPGPIAPS